MTNTIDYDLKEILIRLEGRFDKLDAKVDKVGEDVNDLKVKMAVEIGELKIKVSEAFGELKTKVSEDFGELKTKVSEDFGGLRTKVSEDFGGLRTDLTRVENSLKGEIEVVAAKIDGLSKRVDTQEFINRGVLIGLLLAIFGGFAKVFGLTG